MITSTMNDDLRDKSTDILKKCNNNSILEQLEEAIPLEMVSVKNACLGRMMWLKFVIFQMPL